ncbi:hypothetical protein DL93DRAFT_2090219 [Clavulina sp. PMI_390]|nr:hypothetical protein DL93DRAFT_2090219 [Clavulina sp. PMI_390]
MISVLSRAFAPRTAISLGIGRPLFPLYQSYASSLTELIVSTPLTNDMNFPSLPHLRFVASSNPLIISGFVRSSPVEAIYLWGGDVSSESVLEFELGDALQVRTAEGISSLRSARLCFDVGDDTELGDVICALACPTLEELHLSINCCTWHITAPYLMDEYPVVSLERPELADLFPRVKSIRFQMYDDTRNQGCSTRGHEVPQIPSVEFASLSPLEATRRLAHWLDTDPLPSLERVEIQCLGHGVEQEYCIVDIEASRLPSSGTSDGRWTVTDSRVERRLQEGAACVTAADQPQWSDYISLKHGNQSSNWWEAIEYRSPIYWSAPTSAWMRSSL